jgi:hypothetical protein
MTLAHSSLLGNKWQQGDMSRPFDGFCQAALVLGTSSSLTPRPNPAELVHIPLQVLLILVINVVDMIDTESTNTPASAYSATTSSPLLT